MANAAKELKTFEVNSKWLSRHYDELSRKYPREYIAIHNRKVVDHNRNVRNLTKKLEKKYPHQVNEIAVEYVSPEKFELILCG